MILRNNPEIDTTRLEAHVATLRASRRRAHVPESAPAVAVPGGPSEFLEAPASAAMPERAGADGGPATTPSPADETAASRVEPAGAPRAGFAVATTPAWRARVAAIPLLGWLLALLGALLRLPRFRRDVVAVHEAMRAELRRLHDAQRRSDLALARLNEAQAQAPAPQPRSEIPDALARRQQLTEQRCAELENRLAAQTQAIRRLELAMRPVPSVPREGESGTHAVAGGTEGVASLGGAFGSFYAEFEARFRGAREAIKDRQRTYLAPVRQATGARPGARCVDIGCGRGEWLELLAEEGIDALGFDLDASMAGQAQRAGLDARVGEGIAWLEQQAPASVDVVTAFQVIEHLPFDALIRLLDAALRALTPEGVAIFETPNPENLLVATSSFYLDPTHQRPIPAALAEFLAQQRGFARVEVLRINALPARMHLPGKGESTRRLNELLYGAQDYALIAWKQARAPAD